MRKMSRPSLWLFVWCLTLSSACVADPPSDQFACDPGACPPHQTCVAGRCRLADATVDGAVDGGDDADAGDAHVDGISDVLMDGALDGTDTSMDTCVPSAEVCDGSDNDCDPSTADGAEDPALGEDCGDPALCSAGTFSCVDGALRCDPAPIPAERCNGVDDDCDTRVDEEIDDPRVGVECCGGETVCTAGAIRCDVPPLSSSIEVCDAADNDCDGTIDEGACDCDMYRRDGSTYTICTNNTEWGPAATLCEAQGYSLVTIDDADEQVFLSDAIDETGRERRFFIGIRRFEGELIWRSGAPVSFTSWRDGEPATGNDCGVMDRLRDGLWEMHRCGNNVGHICETNAAPWSPPTL